MKLRVAFRKQRDGKLLQFGSEGEMDLPRRMNFMPVWLCTEKYI